MTTHTLPCSKCGRIVKDIRKITPSGILMNHAITYECKCGAPRAIVIDAETPQDLVRNARDMDLIMRALRG